MKKRKGIAFIHTGAWGDLYVSTAALKSASDLYPQESITIVGSEKWLKILEPKSWPGVANIFVSEDGRSGDLYEPDSSGLTWQRRIRGISLRGFFKNTLATFNIRTESLRYGIAPFLARVPIRHGSAPFPWNHILYTHASPWLGKDPVIHERERMLQVVAAPDKIEELANAWKVKGGLPALKQIDRENAAKITAAEFGKYWLINPTASRREKAWPAARFRELFVELKPLLEKNGMKLRILGSPLETDWLKEALPNGERLRPTVVQPEKYGELFDIVAGAQVLITNTSSLQFVSAGFGVKTLTLMGNANPAIWGPLGLRDVIIKSSLAPTECTEVRDIFARESLAFERISVAQVLDACRGCL